MKSKNVLDSFFLIGSVLSFNLVLLSSSFTFLYWYGHYHLNTTSLSLLFLLSILISIGGVLALESVFGFCFKNTTFNNRRLTFYFLVPSLILGYFFLTSEGAPFFKLKAPSVIKFSDSLILKSPDGINLSIQQVPIKVLPENKLKLSFEVKSESVNSKIPLIVDLYGEKYDLPSLDIILKKNQITHKYKKFIYILDSGEKIPKDVYLRAYTLSTTEVQIKNLQVELLNPGTPLELYKKLLELSFFGWLIFLIYLSYKLKAELKENIIPFYGMLFIYFIYVLLYSDLPFYHDSLGYWEYGKLFEKNGSFSFLNYDLSLRGYLLPFFCYLITITSDFLNMNDKILFRLISALVHLMIFWKLFPILMEKLFSVKLPSFGKMIFASLFFVFWRGYMLFPLTDYFSLGSLLLGYILLLSACESSSNKVLCLIGSGVFLGAAVNLRPSYILVLFLPFIFILLKTYKEKFIFLKKILVLILGIGIILFPQILINKKYFSTSSPFVQMSQFYGTQDFMQIKLFGGLKIQRVETYVGKEASAQQIRARDSIGIDLLKTDSIEEFKGYIDYIKFALRHPVKMFNLYLRHLLNGMNVMFETPYVEKLDTITTYFYQIFNYILLFIFFLITFYKFPVWLQSIKTDSGKDFSSVLVFGSLFLPTVVSLPTEIEIRFFIPIYMFIYWLVSLELSHFQNKNEFWYFRKKFLFYLIIFIAFALFYSESISKDFYFFAIGLDYA